MLIDTHVLLWFQLKPEKLNKNEQYEIMQAHETGELYMSAILLWEVAMLAKYQRISLQQPFQQWRKMTQANIKVIDISADIAVESIHLPGCEHKDPADRFIIATARVHDIPLMTHDQKILAYAKKGHVSLLTF